MPSQAVLKQLADSRRYTDVSEGPELEEILLIFSGSENTNCKQKKSENLMPSPSQNWLINSDEFFKAIAKGKKALEVK